MTMLFAAVHESGSGTNGANAAGAFKTRLVPSDNDISPCAGDYGLDLCLLGCGHSERSSRNASHSVADDPEMLVRVVCTENSVLIDYVTESLNVSGDDRSVMLVPDRVGL